MSNQEVLNKTKEKWIDLDKLTDYLEEARTIANRLGHEVFAKQLIDKKVEYEESMLLLEDNISILESLDKGES